MLTTHKIDTIDLGQLLKQARNEGVSIECLTKMVGCTQPEHILNWERGRDVPIEFVPRLAKALNVDPRVALYQALSRKYPEIVSYLFPLLSDSGE